MRPQLALSGLAVIGRSTWAPIVSTIGRTAFTRRANGALARLVFFDGNSAPGLVCVVRPNGTLRLVVFGTLFSHSERLEEALWPRRRNLLKRRFARSDA